MVLVPISQPDQISSTPQSDADTVVLESMELVPLADKPSAHETTAIGVQPMAVAYALAAVAAAARFAVRIIEVPVEGWARDVLTMSVFCAVRAATNGAPSKKPASGMTLTASIDWLINRSKGVKRPFQLFLNPLPRHQRHI